MAVLKTLFGGNTESEYNRNVMKSNNLLLHNKHVKTWKLSVNYVTVWVIILFSCFL